MKKLFLGFILILLGCLFLQGQTVLTYEGQTYNDTQTGTSNGINVPRSTPTTFSFLKNSVTAVNVQGYMLQAGDEGISSTNNNLRGELIQGNKFSWNGNYSGLGTSMTITHGVFTGCNIDVNIKHNYLYRVPMGIIRKSASNMVNTTGGVSYNIIKTFNVGGVVKGMSNVNWYNNTFYQDRPTYSSTDPTAGTWRGAIDVYTNTDVTPNSVAHGTKIKNNIFYSKYKTLAIDVMDAESLIGFECDYNVYWVEEGDHTPVFNAGGSTKTWSEWRAMGYDAHSVVMNPNFIDFENFVPTARLNYGTDLGAAFNTGLATNATWTVGASPATQVQNGTWQVGARIYAPTTTTITIEGQTVNDSNNPVDDNYAAVRIDNSTKAQLYYRNNSITSINQHGYMLDAGDESVLSTNNNLDNAVITGNKFTWNGTQTGSVITHGLLVGYNINDIVKYNYLTNVPYGIIFKSGSATSNMTITSGGASYNIVKNGRFAGRVKGINGARFYNNTFYGDANSWYLILITSNADNGTPFPSTGTKIKNNIFYTATKTPSIKIESGSLTGFECNYNVYWCEAGDHTPVFSIDGVSKTWTEWRALGYDANSIVINPNFNNTTDFVPAARLNYGTDLGTEYNTGLATTATWTVGSAPATQIQNGTWQVGARIYAPLPPTYFLYVSKHNITIPATANSDGKFNIISNTEWNVVSSQPWLTVGVELYYSLGAQGYKTQLYSGSAPDIGAFEYMQTNASGHDSAFVTLTAEANVGALRTATVTVSGTGVTSQIVNVTQEGVTPPVGIPIYISSLITSATPNVIEMTYDKSLANIVPSTTAFTVKVNSISKDVVSVSISDTKVILTLSSNVYSGNAVTVAYTKPEINPLQTPTGYQAESITAQPVTNNSATIQTTFYLSPTGSDVAGVGDGTFEDPWFTLNKGWSVLSAGYTLYLRGGVYRYDAEQYLTNKNGAVDNYIKVWAYQNEIPVINPSVAYTGNVGITVEEVNYVHIKGLDVSQYTQRTSDNWYNGIVAADANNCIFEKLNVHHNGFGMSLSRWTTGNPVSGNLFLNCDFHHNYDPITAIEDNFPYGGSDGLTIRVDNPNSTNTVRGCRFWNNSDDGFDGWYNAGFLLFDNCWFFNNGYREDGITQGGDGNGLKLGPLVANPWTGYETQHKRTVQNCIAFNNRVMGFDQNQARCIMYFYNNVAYNNGYHGFVLNNENAIIMIARNNISYKNKAGQAYFNSVSVLDHNTFTYNNGINSAYSITDTDFVSLDATGTDGVRFADGSLPVINFLQLADGSDLIKRGVDVGLPYTGTAPDLGAFDYFIKSTGDKSTMNKGKRVVRQGTPIKH